MGAEYKTIVDDYFPLVGEVKPLGTDASEGIFIWKPFF